MSKKLLNLLPKIALGAVCVFGTGMSSPSYAYDARECGAVFTRCNDVLGQILKGAKPTEGTAKTWLCNDFSGDGMNNSYKGDCYGKWGNNDNSTTNTQICEQMASFPGGVYVKWCRDRKPQL